MTNSQASQPDLDGLVAIVTGAGSGIGRAEALRLALAGCRVVVNDLGTGTDGQGSSPEPAAAVVDEIRALGGEAIAQAGDVALASTASELVGLALARFGRLDIVINNAGIVRPAPFPMISSEDWERTVEVNLTGHYRLVAAAAPVFCGQRSGRILNTSSGAGLGMALMAAYGAAKEGVTGFTRTLALELAAFDVTVNQVRPRASDTRMMAAAATAAEAAGTTLGAVAHGAADSSFLGGDRTFTSAQVAEFVVFLCGPDAADITGGDFLVGGGEVVALAPPRPGPVITWGSPTAVHDLRRSLASCSNPALQG